MFPRLGIHHHHYAQRVPVPRDRQPAGAASFPQELAMLLRLGTVAAILVAVTASVLGISG